mgnify:CR=1 FL=1
MNPSEIAKSYDQYKSADTTNNAIDKVFELYGARLSPEQFVVLFFIFAAESERYTQIGPTIKTFEILLKHSDGL